MKTTLSREQLERAYFYIYKMNIDIEKVAEYFKTTVKDLKCGMDKEYA